MFLSPGFILHEGVDVPPFAVAQTRLRVCVGSQDFILPPTGNSINGR
jgi:hypothetical protein